MGESVGTAIGTILVSVLPLLPVGLILTWQMIEFDNAYPAPWNWLASYLYIAVKWPLTEAASLFWYGCVAIWHWSVTGFPNLNSVINIVVLCLFFYLSFLLFLVGVAAWLLFLPAIIAFSIWLFCCLITRGTKSESAATAAIRGGIFYFFPDLYSAELGLQH